MLLIFPPLAKACEPPAGITRIAGFLRGNKQRCRLWDANIEGQLYLLGLQQTPIDTWSKRAWKNVQPNLQNLRDTALYESNDRYQRAVRDLNRAISQSCNVSAVNISLADYQDNQLSPHRSQDLLLAAGNFQNSIFFPFFQARLKDLFAEADHQHIGISLNYLSQALPAFCLAGLIREEYPDITIIAGGGLVTSWLRSPGWNNPFTELFDHMVEGQGELPLLEILSPDTPSRHQPPDFSDLPLAHYLSPGLLLPYSASTGCYWNRCSFCPEKAEGSPYAKLSTKQVMEDLNSLVSRHKPRLIHLLDNAVAPSLMKQIIQEPPGADWYGFARVTPELGDLSFCKKLQKSGCVLLKLGIESGSQEVLDAMDKGIDLTMVEDSLRALRLAGIATYVYLLFGTPTESHSEARQTLDFTQRNAEAITFLNLAVFNLPHNSRESSTLQLREFSSGDLGLYSDFYHPRGWDRKAVRNFLCNEFRTDPTVRTILQRDPPFFTSNHAPLILQSDARYREGNK
ncbi:Fe-S oxidoreductase [Desulfocapsa sulfexigens DSM 10523]|uniref:Fe-S oxidoreductase n=1 Tax=Desulfocapsa sulfexigens (strain DSM 10523 / SB164P1) TaxID=1167006 RepID=M1NAJ7_DESSD|nr:radical SAM protein [Desulfocapsa sulfexigens]AGF76869.1 Fe-S oxidoreductase [Desulfocapsa sulfexigens DSM 10523]